MNTDEFARLLATGAGVVEPDATKRRVTAALSWGLFATTLLMAVSLGVRVDLVNALTQPMFWIKLLFPLSVAACAYVAVTRLARPGVVIPRRSVLVLVSIFAAVWLMALVALIAAPSDRRVAMLLGSTWETCVTSVALLSIPVFAGAFWALKGLAPTRLALAGGAAGLLAGAVAAAVYALHCPETSPAFLGVWYVLGMLIPTVIGASVGPRLLRW